MSNPNSKILAGARLRDLPLLFAFIYAVIFWVLEAILHRAIFQQDNLITEIFLPGSHELWMRLLVVTIIFGFGVYAQYIVNWRKRKEEALTLVNKELDQVFNTAADGMRVIDKDFNVLRINETLCGMSGVSEKEALSRKCYETFHGPQCYTKDCPLEKMGVGAERLEFDIEKERKDGTKIPCIVVVTPFLGVDGELIGVVEDFKDITERKQAEEDRLGLERQIQQTQKLESLGVLAGGIAHDFNNILMAILGHADLALIDLPTYSPARGSIREIEKASHRAAELCRQMLAYSGKGRFIIESIELQNLVEEILHLLQASISKKISLNLNIEKNMPLIQGDATQIRQIILNLVMNASEAIGEVNGVINISTGVKYCSRDYLYETYLHENLPDGKYVYLEVSDTGCGMDANTKERIFEPFYTTKFAGRGLGMSAVLGIVRGHKGTLKIESEHGKGTTFIIFFPAAGYKDVAVRKVKGVDGDDFGKGKTILLVDDEETIRVLGRKMIERLGFKVITASDGFEAIELYREMRNEIDLVLLDLTMPRMDGEETFKELYRLNPDVRVVMSSGYTEDDVLSRISGNRLAGFVAKPYNLAALKERLQSIF